MGSWRFTLPRSDHGFVSFAFEIFSRCDWFTIQLFAPPIIIIDRYMFFTRFSARVSYYARKRSTVSLDWEGGEGLTQKDPVSLGSHANRLSSNLETEISNCVIAQLSQTFKIRWRSSKYRSLYTTMRMFQEIGIVFGYEWIGNSMWRGYFCNLQKDRHRIINTPLFI